MVENPRPGGCSCAVVFLGLIAVGCAASVLLGSFAHGTTRTYDGGAPNSGTIAQEGAGRWAISTFACGLAALSALGLAAGLGVTNHRAPGAISAVLAAPPFAIAAVLAGRNWRQLLAERDMERNYSLDIAAGLPMVTVAGALGAALALLLAGVMLINRR